MPSTASVRTLLEEVLITDTDLNAFCIDYFSEIHREFSEGMQRTAKLNLLLGYVPAGEIFARPKERYPDAVDHCLRHLPHRRVVSLRPLVHPASAAIATNVQPQPAGCLAELGPYNLGIVKPSNLT